MTGMNPPPATVVLVWRNEILPGSETFIRNQISAMRRWQPRLAGASRTQSALSRDDDAILFGAGRAEWARRKAFRFFRRSARLNRLISQEHVSVVHAHFGPDAITVFPTARRLGLPLVITFHGYDVTKNSLFTGFEGWRYRRRIRQAIAYASRVVVISEFMANMVITRLGADPAKVIVRTIGIPLNTAHPELAVEKEWDLVFVGRLTLKKGVDHLLRAVASLTSANRAARIAVVGGGALADELQALAAQLALNVTFLGRLSPAEVSDVLARSGVFVGPSRTAESGDAEGFGMVFLEAALASLPVVAYRHGGVPEVVVDGVTGLLAAESDVETLAEHIDYLLTNPEVAARMGALGRERVIRDFDVEGQTVRLEQIYDELVQHGR